MNCFQLIKSVLDEIYVQIPGSDEEKDQLITKKIDYLYDRYRNLLEQQEPINYQDAATRFAYIYKYVPFHANIMYNVIKGSKELQALFTREKLRITCLGGGPGSDLLGILKYCEEADRYPNITFTLLDSVEGWAESWEDVGDKLSGNIRINSVFQRLNVTQPDSWASKAKYLNANIFTMMYFASEVYSAPGQAVDFFNNLFSHIPSDSYVVFIDNNSTDFINYFEQFIPSNGNFVVNRQKTKMGIQDASEEKTDLGKYYQKFHMQGKGRPKLTADIVIHICHKVGS
mgnify:CR=1 FL=1